MPVRRELLEALAATAPKAKTVAAAEPPNGHAPHRPCGVGVLRVPSSAEARCRAYVYKVGPAIAGQHGHNATFKVARIIFNDFGLNEAEGYPILEEFNRTCDPPWDDEGLRRKWDEAVKKGPGPEGRGFKLGERVEQKQTPDRGDAWEPPGPHNIEFDPSEFEERKEPRPRFRWQTADEFDAEDCRSEFLITDVLVATEPATIAGVSKTLKTLIGLDAMLSLAGGGKFLGRFDVPTRRRAAIVSGESGKPTLQRSARRIAKARGYDHAKLADWLHWCFDMPVLSDVVGMTDFADQLAERKIEAVLLDPLYLMLGAVDAKSMFEMGPLLRVVGELLINRGITPVIVHHAKKGGAQTRDPMELADLAFSGLDQFVRQWLLIARRERYERDGAHKLWLNVGGSAFTGNVWAADVDEGQSDEQFNGRTWDVTVRPANDARADQTDKKRDERKAAQEKKEQDEELDLMRKLDALDPESNGYGVRALRLTLSWNDEKATRVVARLREQGLVEACEVKAALGSKATRSVVGIRRI